MGYDEELASKALKVSGCKSVDAALEVIHKLMEQDGRNGAPRLLLNAQGLSGYTTKVIRKPSFEEKYRQNSKIPDNNSARSDSPSINKQTLGGAEPPRINVMQVDGGASLVNGCQTPPPPPIPPRNSASRGHTPPPSLVPDGRNLRHISPIPKEMVSKQRGVSPVSYNRQPVLVQQGYTQNGSTGKSAASPVSHKITVKYSQPPPYTQPKRPAPVIPCDQASDSSSTGYDICISAGNNSNVSINPMPAPMAAWGAKQAPIIMQSVKSREVQKPVLQTATVPVLPSQPAKPPTSLTLMSKPPMSASYTTSLHTQISAATTQPTLVTSQAPSRNVQIQISHNSGQTQQNYMPSQSTVGHPSGRTIQIHIQNQSKVAPHNRIQIQNVGHKVDAGYQGLYYQGDVVSSRPDSPVQRGLNHSPVSVTSTLSTPSTNSDQIEKPPPPYPGRKCYPVIPPPPDLPPPSPSNGGNCDIPSASEYEDEFEFMGPAQPVEKQRCTSPIPERKPEAKKKDEELLEFKVKNYSPQAFKFFMEQHVENVLKSHQQRLSRRVQLENEMAKVGLSEEAQCQMRKMLHQKESNYIRLKRAKMDKDMFDIIKTLGTGAFGKVHLVRKIDTSHLYAMKTLRKSDVLKRNQVAHVKAERDILAEADNEWVVKLYYSFQDRDHLYFVMDYIPGGDMMSLLMKFGIFEEHLTQFYIAELVLAIESVHKMGFIHRDIKPDNILIDRDGHIKLTDFGLCTGFRWTHNSKYYQKGNHANQDSMDGSDMWGELVKPLQRRKQQEQRYLAHSLVGTPNYIAPEVLLRSGYTACCDWWSVGVILYEMLVGQPPFLAATPAETQRKVIQWAHTLHIPHEANLSRAASDLILRLCRDPEDRLGRNGASEIHQDNFFKGINFEGLRRQVAPYIPTIKYATDTSNFDDAVEVEKSHQSDDDLIGKDSSCENGKNPDHHAFLEFTFRRFFDEGGHAYATRCRDPETDAPVYV